MKKRYTICSIHKNTRFVSDGWVYNIQPVHKAIQAFDMLVADHKNKIKMSVEAVDGNEKAIICLKGRRSVINDFVRQLNSTNFFEHFSWKEN